MKAIEARYGIGYWTLDHLRKGKAKTCEVRLYDRIKNAFIDHCFRQASRLLHEAELAKAGNKAGKSNVDLESIEDQIRALARRLEAAKAQGKVKPFNSEERRST